MEKINFEAGTQVSPAKVTIDNVEHEVTPSVWEGNTPLSPFVLNKMQSNIENAISESGVIVSAVEPTGANREKVWLQKGENLFNYETANYLLAYSNITTMKITASSSSDNHRSSYIKCKPNTTYTIKKKAGHSFRVSTTTNVPAIGVTINNSKVNHAGTTITITTGENDNYIFFTCFSTVNGDTGDYIDMYKTVIIEEGTNIISDKMYVLNDNNVYEEFILKENEIYSTEEQVIGTYAGKPLYKKTLSLNTPSTTSNTVVGNFDSTFIVRHYYGDINVAASNQLLPINFYFTEEYNITTYVTNSKGDKGKINMKVGSASYINQAATITLEYTKTTD